MTDRPFSNQRDAALALLNGNSRITRKAGQFLGQLAVDTTELSEAQSYWLAQLLERAQLPHLVDEKQKRALVFVGQLVPALKGAVLRVGRHLQLATWVPSPIDWKR